MSGSSNQEDPGIYGVQGVPSVNNYPAARTTNVFWKDNAGNFWLSGGIQIGHYGQFYEDVWKFNPYSLEWTWVNGPGYPVILPAKGAVCEASDTATEGTRYENRAVWKVCDDLIINYGGANTYAAGDLNDLWAYSPSQNKWENLGGWSAGGYGSIPYYYGDKGIPGALNFPPLRSSSVGFKDKNNNLFMFGGSDGSGFYNDMWKYVLDSACLGSLYCNQSCNLYAPFIASNSTAICPSDSAQICSPSGFVSYIWKNGETGRCIQARDTGNYYVIVTDSAGCSARSNDINVVMLKPPLVAITADTMFICATDSAHICATSGFTSYYWNNTDTTNCIIAIDTGNYYVVVTDTAGCSIKSSSINITMSQLQPVTILANTDVICPDDSAHICAPTGFVSYSWNINSTSKCIEAKNAGNYYITVTDNSGCTAESNHITITVLQSPPVTISRNGDTLRVYNAPNVQWFLNNNPIPNAISNIYIANTSGSYTVAVTDTNGCTSFSSPVAYTGIGNINEDENISIYPNPLAVGSWQLIVGNNLIGGQLDILDDNGRIVYKTENKSPHSEISSLLPGGIYLLRITSGKSMVSRKLVKL